MTTTIRSSARGLAAALMTMAILAGAGCGGGDDDPAPGGGALTAPSNLMLMKLDGTSLAIHVTWKDISGEHHYVVERKVGTGAFAEMPDPPVFDREYYHDDHDVKVGTTYTYRVAGALANNTKGPWSAEASITP